MLGEFPYGFVHLTEGQITELEAPRPQLRLARRWLTPSSFPGLSLAGEQAPLSVAVLTILGCRFCFVFTGRSCVGNQLCRRRHPHRLLAEFCPPRGTAFISLKIIS